MTRPCAVHRLGVACLVAALLLGLGGCRGGGAPAPEAPADAGTQVLPQTVVGPLAEALPRRTVAAMPTTRLADGLTPPTNRWFSGLVFGDEPQPVQPLPLTFTGANSGFGFGLPQVVVSAASVVGSNQQDVQVTLAEATEQVVSAYDDASFTLSHREAGGAELGRTTVARGSLAVSHLAVRDERLTTSLSWSGSGEVWSATAPTGTYGLVVRDGTVDGRRIALDAGGSATFFPVPAGKSAADLARFVAPVDGTRTAYEVGEQRVATSLTYTSGRETSGTPFVLLPVQAAGASDGVTCDLGSFPSVYGDLPVCRGESLAWEVPRQQAVAGLDLSGLSSRERAELARQVADDVDSLPASPPDTYYGGKWLFRTAQLLDVAAQVGAEEAERTAQERLTAALVQWTEPAGCDERASQCFVADPRWKGIVGLEPAYGSEEFNDHHFHYGYFLHAAGVLARHDPAVSERLRPVLDLLAADVAGGADTEVTPRLRAFDVYAGHSWASGTAPFADGNNQESSSEAVNAWAGLRLWAEATGDDALAAHAAWLHSAEAASARAYWTEPSTPDGFAHRVFGINWGGKRDHATWFSPAESAILGIQLIPMGPSTGHLDGDPDRIAANVAEVGEVEQLTGPLSDYVLLYSALAGPAAARTALTAARAWPEQEIDDGLSRTYLLAFALAQAARD